MVYKINRKLKSRLCLIMGSKAAIVGHGSGVKCSTVCPAAIDTPWWDRPMYPDGQTRPKPAAKHLLDANEVVDRDLNTPKNFGGSGS